MVRIVKDCLQRGRVGAHIGHNHAHVGWLEVGVMVKLPHEVVV